MGGLLYQNDIATSTTMIPAYDGNGNVMALLKRSDSSGAFAAAYEYDAFGQTLAAYGTHAAANPFRFSTKYTDTETGLLYYGLRYYSPSLGRWLNRDPIAERGGLNLYAFVVNNGINRWDYRGMYPQRWNPLRLLAGEAEVQFFRTQADILRAGGLIWEVRVGAPAWFASGPWIIPRLIGGIPWDLENRTRSKAKSGKIVDLKPDQKMLVIYNGGALRGFDNNPNNADGDWFRQNAMGLQNEYGDQVVPIDVSGPERLFRSGSTPTLATRILDGAGIQDMDMVTIIDHSAIGQPSIGGYGLSFDSPFWSEVSEALSSDGAREVILYGCNVAGIGGRTNGPEFLQQTAIHNNITIRGAAFEVYTNSDGTLNLEKTPSNAVWVVAKPDGSVTYEPVAGGQASPLPDPRPALPSGP